MKNPTILGAIAGDIIGSVYEFNPTKSYDFELLTPQMEYTDDSIMTIAVADWILRDPELTHKGLVDIMRDYGRRYPSPMGSYGSHFNQWLQSDNPRPYNSWGNGSAMRVSAVGFAFSSMRETLRVAKISAEVTHNHPEGIKGAMAVAAAIFMARRMATKQEIRDYLEANTGYDLHRPYDDVQKNYHFDGSCQGTVPESIIAFLESDDYEDAIRKTVALGGDADTMGAITGAIAAAYYGEVPDDIAGAAIAALPLPLFDVTRAFTAKYGDGQAAGRGGHRCGVTPERVTSLQPGQVFVFGSNLMGQHAGGAARTAYKQFGAVWGMGVGMQGQSYAIPTMQGPVSTIRPYVDQFLDYAAGHPELHFLVTPIGCGIAGFQPGEIAPLFARAVMMSNVSLPETFLLQLVR